MNDYNSIAIFEAAHNGDLDSLSALLNKLNLQETLSGQRTLLHVAASRGLAHIVDFLIKNDANIDAKDIYENTPLLIAISENYMEVAKIFIQNGADVKIRNRNEENPLYIATKRENIQLVDMLLKNGADVNIVNKYGETLLNFATKLNNIQLVDILLKNGADVNIRNRNGEKPLYIATKLNNVQLVDMFLKNGADVNIVNKYEETLLNFATRLNNIQLVDILLKYGADVNIRNRNEEKPLYIATKRENIQLVDMLLENGADVNIVNKYGETLLNLATKLNNIQLVDILLKNGADVNIVNKYRETPIHFATKLTNIQLVDILLKNGADVNIVNVYGETPLLIATKLNNIQLIDILLKHGADVNIVNVYGETPLLIATDSENIQLVEILLKNGADVNIVNKYGATPLHFATKKRNIEIVENFLKNDADVNTVNDYGETPLYIAFTEGNLHLINILLQNSAKLNGQDKFRKIILLAAEKNDIELIEILFKHAAKIYQPEKTYEGRTNKEHLMTALHFAARNGNLKMVKLLMTNGFDRIDAINEMGETPLDLSIQSNCLNVVKHLIENGAKIRSKPVLEEALHFGNLEVWKYLLTCNSTIIAKTCPCDSELHLAVRAGQVEIVEEIIEKEASKVKSYGSAVYIAVENGNEEILKILLTAGFSIENFLGINPLHVAATFEHTRLVELLLKFGANINLQTDEHQITPLDFAAAAGHANMVKFLLDVGANPMVNRISDLTSLHYALHRLPDNANETCVTALMFQNLLKITEILLITGVNKIDKDNYKKLIINAIKLTVSSDDEQNLSCFNSKEISKEGNINDEKNNEKGEFRPEIIRCLLNYFKENKVNGVLDNLSYCNPEISSKIANVIMEYYDYRNISLSSTNYWITVHVIDQIEDIHYLLNLTRSAEINILKMYVARLELLPCDQQAKKKKVNFYNNFSVFLDWRNECQKQLINMQKTKIIDESNVTFYDILMKSIKKVSIKIRNERLLNSLEFSIEKFPIYADFFKIRVSKGKQRNELIDMCVNGMFRLIEKNYKITFSSEGIEEILQYLSVIELRKLSMACFSLFS